MARPGLAKLALALVGDEPPTEFRLFVAGVNESENGAYTFDKAAADSVMAAYKAHGVDVMVDLEHLSLEPTETSVNWDGDARAWVKLELRADGSLWAVDVKWTPDGAKRLRDKTQRYVSPAFIYDEEGRIKKLVNVAITALPATHGTPELVKARAKPRDLRKLSAGVGFNDTTAAIRSALVAKLGTGEGYCSPWIQDVFDSTVVYEFGTKLWEITYAFDGATVTLGALPVEVRRSYSPITPSPAPAPAPPAQQRTKRLSVTSGEQQTMTPEQLMALGEALGLGPDAKVEEILAAVGEMMAKVKGDAPVGEPAPAEDKSPEGGAATARLILLTAKPTAGEALREVALWKASHLELQGQLSKLAQDRAVLEAVERKGLVVRLVTECGESPMTAWSLGANGLPDGVTPSKLWASYPLEDLRDRVEKLSKIPKPKNPEAPKGGAAGADGLSAREIAKCTARGIDPAKLAKNKAAIAARSTRSNAQET